MNKIYIKFILTLLLLTTVSFMVFRFIAGLDSATEMLFVITVLSACTAVKFTMHEVEQETLSRIKKEEESKDI
jgi:hypothetical protein